MKIEMVHPNGINTAFVMPNRVKERERVGWRKVNTEPVKEVVEFVKNKPTNEIEAKIEAKKAECCKPDCCKDAVLDEPVTAPVNDTEHKTINISISQADIEKIRNSPIVPTLEKEVNDPKKPKNKPGRKGKK